jgi:hypothetical protein
MPSIVANRTRLSDRYRLANDIAFSAAPSRSVMPELDSAIANGIRGALS